MNKDLYIIAEHVVIFGYVEFTTTLTMGLDALQCRDTLCKSSCSVDGLIWYTCVCPLLNTRKVKNIFSIVCRWLFFVPCSISSGAIDLAKCISMLGFLKSAPMPWKLSLAVVSVEQERIFVHIKSYKADRNCC